MTEANIENLAEVLRVVVDCGNKLRSSECQYKSSRLFRIKRARAMSKLTKMH